MRARIFTFRPVAALVRARLLAVLLLCPSLLAPDPACAQYERLGFGRFKHTRWTVDDGAPEGIYDIAQTPDGYLWLATRSGAYRFDGVVFEHIAPPQGSRMERQGASALLVKRSGELWIAFGSAGVAAYRGGRLVDLGMPKPPSTLWPMLEMPDGSVWVAFRARFSEKRLTRWYKGRWEFVAEPFGLPSGIISSMAAGSDRALWVTLYDDTKRYLLRLPSGARKFELISYPKVEIRAGLGVDRRGRLWLSDSTGTRVVLEEDGRRSNTRVLLPARPPESFYGLQFDHAGGIWESVPGSGVLYIPNADAVLQPPGEQSWSFTAKDGLTSDLAYAGLVDAEGNIWIGTNSGLDQFRAVSILDEPIVQYKDGPGRMAGTTDGSVYMQANEGTYLAEPGQVPRRIGDEESTTICAAYDRGIWAIGLKRVLRFEGDRLVETFPMPPGMEYAGECAAGRDGLVVRMMSMKLIRHDAQGWHTVGDAAEQERSNAHWDLLATPAGEVAYEAADRLVRLRGSRRVETPVDMSKLESLSSISRGPRDIFINGKGGVLRLRGDQAHFLSAGSHPWLSDLRAIAQTPRGQTWLVNLEGISLVATADFDRAFEDPGFSLERRLFDTRDGATEGVGPRSAGGPTIVVGGDGRVWFRRGNGYSFIDPARMQRNSMSPKVAIRSLAAGGISHRDPAKVVLPPGTRSLEIAYAGLSLAVPQRVKFRYRIEGVDDDWVDPGARRLASYSNLGPGRYRFQVIAANNDGVWNRSGATLEFEIRPTFLQSWPFRLLVGLAAIGLLWLAYSMRLRTVARRIRQRMAERIEERERIARELHDTLLQSVQSLTLRFQLAVDDLPEQAPARPALESAIDRADQVIAEGRDRVRDLRPLEECDIEQIIADIVARQAFAPEVAISVRSGGKARTLDPLALDEVSRIASEAIINIWRHAEASEVTIDIGYDASFTLRFVDNGKGIPAEILAAGKPGHFGLPGMRERARKLSGELSVRGLPAGGTEVLLTVPGSIAYKASGRWLLPRFGNQG